MRVRIYDNQQYTTGRDISSNNLTEQAFSLYTVQSVGVTYEYTQTVSVTPEDTDTVVLSTATQNYGAKTFYVKPYMRIDVNQCSVTPAANMTHDAVCTFSLSVSGVQINSSGLSLYGIEGTTPEMRFVFTSCMIGGKQYFGFVAHCTGDNLDSATGFFVSQNFFDGSIAPRYQDGASGSDQNSGYGDNDTASTNAATLGTPPGIGTGNHGLRVYEIPAASLDKIYETLFSWNPILTAERWISSIKSSIVSIHKMPDVSNTQWTQLTNVKFGGIFEIACTAKRVLPTIEGVQTPEIPIGTVQGDFLDYSHTAASIYLPFCGEFPVNIQDVMRGSLSVKYIFDYVNGNCVANVYTTSGDGVRKLLGCYAGNAAYKMPVMGDDGSGAFGTIATVAGVASAFMLENPALLATAAGNLQGAMPKVYASGAAGGNSAYYSDTTIALHLYRPKAVYPENYAAQVGRPTADGVPVSRYKGFLSGIVHAEIAGATDAEKAEIESAFSGGVIV